MDEYKQSMIDNYFVIKKCPKCNKKTHEPVVGKFLPFNGGYLVQRHCSNCHHTDVTSYPSGKVRDGIIEEPPLFDTEDPFALDY